MTMKLIQGCKISVIWASSYSVTILMPPIIKALKLGETRELEDQFAMAKAEETTITERFKFRQKAHYHTTSEKDDDIKHYMGYLHGNLMISPLPHSEI